MPPVPARHFTITGAPGAGKTRVLDVLAERGHTVVPEAPRAIIRDRRARGLSPRPAPRDFARETLEAALRGYRDARGSGPFLHDRGVLDAVGMAVGAGLLTPPEGRALLADHPMTGPVILFPPWAGIYRTDAERDQSFTEAGIGYGRLLRFLRAWEIEWVEVPRIAVAARADFVEGIVGRPVGPSQIGPSLIGPTPIGPTPIGPTQDA